MRRQGVVLGGRLPSYAVRLLCYTALVLAERMCALPDLLVRTHDDGAETGISVCACACEDDAGGTRSLVSMRVELREE